METNKIYNMDCLEGMKQLPDESVDMILCDLPYGTTCAKWDTIINLDKLWEQYKRIIKSNGIIVLFSDEPFTSRLIYSNLKMFKQRITWDKDRKSGFLNANRMLLKQTEDICLFWDKLPTYNPQMVKSKPTSRERYKSNLTIGLNNRVYGKVENHKRGDDFNPELSFPSNLIKVSANIGECNTHSRVHPTQKPLKLIKWLIKTYSNEGNLILDNCMGSGTTAVACVQTRRNFIGYEINKEYYDIAVGRIQSAKSQTQLSNESCPNGEFNMGLKVQKSKISSPKLSPTEITSLNPNIMFNKLKMLQKW